MCRFLAKLSRTRPRLNRCAADSASTAVYTSSELLTSGKTYEARLPPVVSGEKQRRLVTVELKCVTSCTEFPVGLGAFGCSGKYFLAGVSSRLRSDWWNENRLAHCFFDCIRIVPFVVTKKASAKTLLAAWAGFITLLSSFPAISSSQLAVSLRLRRRIHTILYSQTAIYALC